MEKDLEELRKEVEYNTTQNSRRKLNESFRKWHKERLRKYTYTTRWNRIKWYVEFEFRKALEELKHWCKEKLKEIRGEK